MDPVHRFDPAAEQLTPERCAITELLNCADDAACSVARARVAPGVTTQLHALRHTTERYIILSGTGRVEVGGVVTEVGPSGIVRIPPGVAQRITNSGTTDLVFLCVCTPRFTPDAYQNLEPS